MSKYSTVKELKNICKKNKIKGYSKLNKTDLIKKIKSVNKIKGGNIISCHNYDSDSYECNKQHIKKGIQKYDCQFIVHRNKLSQCIRKGHLSKYKNYQIYNVEKQVGNQINEKRIITLPTDIDKKQIQNDLNRYLKGDQIELIINKKPVDSKILKTEKTFVSKIKDGEVMYNILKTIISPGFHNDESVGTFKNKILTKKIFKTLDNLDFIMCNVEIKKIVIEIKNIIYQPNMFKKSLQIKEYMGGNLKCFGSNKLMERPIKNHYVKMEWNSNKDNEIIMSYNTSNNSKFISLPSTYQI